LEGNSAKYAYGYSNCLLSLSNTYEKLSDRQSAIHVCKESIELIEHYKEHFKNYASDLAAKYGNLSWYYLFIKDYQLAEQTVQKALNIDSTKIWIKTNLAHTLLFQGKTREAEEIYNELAQTIYHDNDTYAPTLLEDFEQLEKAKVIPHNVEQDVERIKINLSGIKESVEIYNQFYSLCDSGKYEEAVTLIQPYKCHLPEQHAQWASNILESKGYDEYVNSDDYALTERYWLEAKDIREKVLGEEHPNYITSLNNLVALYSDMGNYMQVEKYLIEIKEIKENTLGKEHPDYITSLSNLGGLYRNISNYAQAEKYWSEAKDIQEKVLGKEHSDYVISLNNLGVLYSSMGDYVQAKGYYVEAKEITEKVLGQEHPIYVISLNNLGILYYDMGDYAQAKKYWLEAKDIQEKVLGK
jgi:tetratricopeptide (TPR) repeat protein